MPTLRRKDGIEFVLQPYRELLTLKKSNLLKKEIRLLAQNNGEFVRLFKQSDGQIEAVFSRDSGYLLGESIWRYFGRPDDLIYCEALPDGINAILVIVRSGKVYLDAKLTLASLRDEFASLVTGYSHFSIYTYGNVPISDVIEEGKFCFDKSYVKTFSELDTPLFDTLVVDEALELLPIEQAVSRQAIGLGSHTFAVVAFCLLIALIIIAWLTSVSHDQKLQIENKPEQAQIDYRKLYLSRLATPDPSVQLVAFARSIINSYSIPGWVVTHATLTGSKIKADVRSLGGSLAILSDWAKIHNAVLNLDQNGARIILNMPVANRTPSATMQDSKRVVAQIIDGMMQIIPYKSVSLQATEFHQVFSSVNLSIDLKNISPTVLAMMSKKLSGLPVELVNCNVSINKGLLSGQIQLTALGK